MKKILLLCFIHGFKGGDDTFGAKSEFAQHLAALLAASLPRIDVRAVTYPQYETRGDLRACVARFRDWLLERVIDLEVARGTASPTVDPGVRTILVGHSMGGIVAAETALGIAGEKPIGKQAESSRAEGRDGPEEKKEEDEEATALNSLMFPYVQGVLAFDTPFLGIAPGVVAHGAEDKYNTVSSALTQLSSISGVFWGGDANNKTAPDQQQGKKPVGALPAPTPQQQQQQGGWGWSRIAMAAGAVGAVAAGGAAAYANRQQISSGWSWVGSHLEFVGCLARREELRRRVSGMARLRRELGVGFANLYTRLGRSAQAAKRNGTSVAGAVAGGDRTFCNLPRLRHGVSDEEAAGMWRAAVNDKAADETAAHMAMFEAAENPGYRQLSEDARGLIVGWTHGSDWYQTSTELELE
ncbi:hypothetical protein GGR56DRAFT_663946 [Xylariaceae sp. FL0804]|nr:hypothetical protein GGR56DRAFT_663946 [Xylariaceae sp. FL0804]